MLIHNFIFVVVLQYDDVFPCIKKYINYRFIDTTDCESNFDPLDDCS